MSDSFQRQLTLNVQLRDDATFDNYFCASELEALLYALRSQLDNTGEPVIYLYGPPGVGKSHLLQAACHLAGDLALYLPLRDFVSFPPADVLQGIEAMNLVCLDDIDAVLGDEDWELALFDFFNRARASGARLLFTGPAAPRALSVDLADLQSRLSWAFVSALPAHNDLLRREILCLRAQRRGLHLPSDVADYILNRAPRSVGSLLSLLDQLDAASLAEQRHLSIPFVRGQLGW